MISRGDWSASRHDISTITYEYRLREISRLLLRLIVFATGVKLYFVNFERDRSKGMNLVFIPSKRRSAPLSFRLNEPRKWRKAMAMLSFDYSRQFSITMYLGILCVPAAWSLSSYKGYRGPPSIAGPRILKKNLCPVNSIPVYREFPSRFNLHHPPLSPSLSRSAHENEDTIAINLRPFSDSSPVSSD